MTFLGNQTGRLEAGGDDWNRTRDLMRDSSISVNGKKPQN
jgi:hypothetical protein